MGVFIGFEDVDAAQLFFKSSLSLAVPTWLRRKGQEERLRSRSPWGGGVPAESARGRRLTRHQGPREGLQHPSRSSCGLRCP